MIMKTISTLACFVLLIACVSKKPLTPTASPISALPEPQLEVKNTPTHTEEAGLIYSQKCGMCHKPYFPTDYSASDWKIIVPDMVNKANRKEVTIGPGQQELILQFLIANAKK